MNKPAFSDRIESIPPSGIRKFFDLVVGSKDIISLGVGEPDFATPWSIREEAVWSIESGKTSYTSNSGLLECRTEIAKYLDTRFQATYDPASEILLTIGVSEAVDIILRTILNPGDEVILPEPGYVCYAPLIQLAEGRTISIDTSLSGFIPDPKAIEAAITAKTKAIILCSPSNPTGMVIPESVLKEILKLAQTHGLWIISDEIYAELNYDTPYTSLASLPGAHDHCILMNGFSKAFAMTGWRLGYVCGPADLISRAVKIHQYAALCAPIMSQYAAIEALQHPEEIEKMRTSYQQRRNLVLSRFEDMGLETPFPKGAFYCFPSIKKTGLTSEAFALKLLEEAKVAVVPGSVFGQGGEGHIRCCYATHIDLLKEALSRIEKFLCQF
jgi:aminotransferase